MEGLLKTVLSFVDRPWKVAALVILGFFGLIGYLVVESRQQIVNVMISPHDVELNKRTAEAVAADLLRRHRGHGVLAILIYDADFTRNRRSIVACEYTSTIASMERWCDGAFDLPIIGDNARFLPLGVAVMEGKIGWIDSSMSPYGDNIEVSVLATSIPPVRTGKRVGILNVYTRQDIAPENRSHIESIAVATAERLVTAR